MDKRYQLIQTVSICSRRPCISTICTAMDSELKK